MSVSLQVTSTRDALVGEIRNQILSGDLLPGAPLTETALAARFGVARPTVRSALQVLVGRHLAEQSHGRSLIVPQFDNSDVEDLFFVRAPLEMVGIRAIIENSRPLDQVETCLEAMESMPDDASWGVRVETHTAFHVALIDAAGSERLSRIYASLQDEIQLCLAQLQRWYPDPQDLASEHRTLLDEIRSGDIDRATSMMQRHLEQAVANFESDE